MLKQSVKKLSLLGAGALLGVTLSLSLSAVAEKEPKGQSLPVDELRTFAEVFGRIKQDYVEPVGDRKLISEAINGMLSGLDPHSAYLDADAFKELKVGTQGEFGGLGIEINGEDGFVKVVSPIEDTPAFRAGIKSGDLIIRIDEASVRGMSLNDAVKRMRGKPNTPITLTIMRKGEAKPLVFKLHRAVIKIQSVKSKLLESGYGYVRITQFQEHTTDMLAKALEGLYRDNKGALKGLVLDLRNDPGGLLNGAVGVSAAFLPKNSLVVYTEGRSPDAKMKLYARPEHYQTAEGKADALSGVPSEAATVPLVVLVNGGSASASEIVAGALQDHKRGIVVGTKTFGKGSVQTILPIGNNSAIKLTTARYFTPNGRSIQAKGIIPDVEVEEATLNNSPSNPSVPLLREADLERHLNNPAEGEKTEASSEKEPKAEAESKAQSESKRSTRRIPQLGKPASKEEGDRELASKSDYQLQQALSILKVQQLLLKKN